MTTTARSGRIRRLWLIGIAVLFLGTTIGGIWLVTKRTPLLLQVATKVVAQGQDSVGDCAWVSCNDYVYFSEDGRTLLRHRLSDGVNTPLIPQLEAVSEGQGPVVSPDGRWVSWSKITYSTASFRTGNYSGPYSLHHYVTRLSDMHTQEASAMLGGGQWEPDSRHLFALLPVPEGTRGAIKPMVFISDAFAGDVHRAVPIETKLASNLGETVMVTPNRLLGISYTGSPDYNGSVQIIECGLDRTLHITHQWSVTPPPHTDGWKVKIAPTGDRVAWLFFAEHVDPSMSALHRLFPFVKAPAQSRQELWISRLDGTEMQIVGQIPDREKNGATLQVSGLRWLPDGRHLSFVYADALWTTPIP